MRNILIIGATSAIAIALTRLYSEAGDCLFLLGRDLTKLQNLRSDCLIRGAKQAYASALNITDSVEQASVLKIVLKQLGKIDIAILAYGTLSDQAKAQSDVAYLVGEININALSIITIASLIASIMEQQKSGSLCIISSVAGDRGRKCNYVYGAAKAAVSSFCQGLRNRLYPNVHVMTVKPGFVNTPMTRHFKKGLLWVEPEVVAKDIYKALEARRDVIYTPWFWRWIMLIIKLIPERYFKRMSL